MRGGDGGAVADGLRGVFVGGGRVRAVVGTVNLCSRSVSERGSE